MQRTAAAAQTYQLEVEQLLLWTHPIWQVYFDHFYSQHWSTALSLCLGGDQSQWRRGEDWRHWPEWCETLHQPPPTQTSAPVLHQSQAHTPPGSAPWSADKKGQIIFCLNVANIFKDQTREMHKKQELFLLSIFRWVIEKKENLKTFL